MTEPLARQQPRLIHSRRSTGLMTEAPPLGSDKPICWINDRVGRYAGVIRVGRRRRRHRHSLDGGVGGCVSGGHLPEAAPPAYHRQGVRVERIGLADCVRAHHAYRVVGLARLPCHTPAPTDRDTRSRTKPKPRWDVHLPGAGDRGGGLAGE